MANPRATAGRAGCVRRLGSMLMAGGATGVGSMVALLLVGVAASAWSYQHYIVSHPGAHLSRDHINAIVAQETPVLYADGVTPVGVFFDEEHRRHVAFKDLPIAYTMGIVAAEGGATQRIGRSPRFSAPRKPCQTAAPALR